MPPIRRSNIGYRRRATRRVANHRTNQSQEPREQSQHQRTQQLAASRASQTQKERAAHNESDWLRMQRNRNNSNVRELQNMDRRVNRRDRVAVAFVRAAFRYDAEIDYGAEQCVAIGSLNIVCQHCKALKFPHETPGLCCAGGKVKLPPLEPPPEPLRSLLSGVGVISNHFLSNISNTITVFKWLRLERPM